MKEVTPEAKVSVSWRVRPETKADLQRISKLRGLNQVAVIETLIREEAEALGLRRPLRKRT